MKRNLSIYAVIPLIAIAFLVGIFVRLNTRPDRRNAVARMVEGMEEDAKCQSAFEDQGYYQATSAFCRLPTKEWAYCWIDARSTHLNCGPLLPPSDNAKQPPQSAPQPQLPPKGTP